MTYVFEILFWRYRFLAILSKTECCIAELIGGLRFSVSKKWRLLLVGSPMQTGLNSVKSILCNGLWE